MQHEIKKAAAFLREGKLVAFPTETVYGLGGNALSDAAVAAIYAAKGRPEFNPLIVHVASLMQAKKYVEFNAAAEKLAVQFWPGPLTLVLPRKKNCALSLLVSAGLDSVAIRVPAHPLAQALLAQTKLPIAAPSANRSGRISPTEAAHVREELGGKIAMILDGGPCTVGIESTVVDGETLEILRPGAVTEEQLFCPPLEGGRLSASSLERGAKREGFTPHASNFAQGRSFSSAPPQGGSKSPGMLASHYAPSKPLRLDATEIREGEGVLAFGAPIPNTKIIENLSPAANLQEAAANLFRMLRKLDAGAATSIAVMPIPEEGLGVAINDRLRRAAEPR